MKNVFLFLLGTLFLFSIGISQEIKVLEKKIRNQTSALEKETLLWELCEEFAWTEPTKVLEYTQDLRSLASVQSDSIKLMKLVQLQGKAQRSIGNYVKSIDLYLVNYHYHQRHQDSIKQAYAANQIGLMNLFNGNMNLAQQYLLEAFEIYQQVGTLDQIASSNNSLGSFYSAMEQPDKAIERYQKALEAFNKAEDIQGMANVNANLGMEYLEIDRLDEAEKHILESGRLDSINMSPYSLGFFHDFLGILRKKQGRYDEAYISLMTALEIRKGLESHYNICETELSLAELHYETQAYDSAIKHALAIFEFQEESQSLSQQLFAYEILAKSYEKKNNPKASLNFYKEYTIINDSIYQRDMIK